MGTRRNVITLNGNRYDAVSGQLLSEQPVKVAKAAPHKVSTVDGFVPKSASTSKPPVKRSTHNLNRTTHKSKTLMRKVVSKPKPIKSTAVPTPQIKKNIATNPTRELRSKDIGRSSLISKFGTEVKNLTKYSPLPISKPPEATVAKSEHSTKQTAPKNLPERPKNQSDKLVENAMRNSQSHNNTMAKKISKRHRAANILKVKPSFLNLSLFILTGLLLTGYFAYNNVPNLAMKVASTRSGVEGTVPGYQAGGFSFRGPIEYKTGQVTITYKSNSDNRQYSVLEKKSEWNSDALLANHVASNGRSYQVLQEKGKTIYIYDGDTASWVDNGVWYEVMGGASLNANQVIKIANSL